MDIGHWWWLAHNGYALSICSNLRKLKKEREENNIKGADDVVHLNIDRRQNSSIKQRDYISTDPFNWTDQQKAWNNRTSNMLTHTDSKNKAIPLNQNEQSSKKM